MRKNNKHMSIRELRKRIVQYEEDQDKEFRSILKYLSNTTCHYLNKSNITSRKDKIKCVNLIIKKLQERYLKAHKLRGRNKELMTNLYQRLSYGVKFKLKLIP